MFKRLGGIIGENKRYLLLGFALMLIGMIIGYLNAEEIRKLAQQMMQSIERIAREISGKDNPVYTFWVIFKNNVLAACSMMGLGIFFFGIYPALGLLTNGILLGFLLKLYATGGGSPLKLFLAGILPHGILELSAIIFAASIGIRLGVLMYEWLMGLFVPGKRAAARNKFSSMLRDLPLIVGTVVVLLFLAAIVESTITPLLIKSVIGQEMNMMKNIMK
jgi:stage II sporulation protein M